MKTISIFLLIYFSPVLLTAQTNTQRPELKRVTTSPVADADFPRSFIGNWKGKMQWMVAGKPSIG